MRPPDNSPATGNVRMPESARKAQAVKNLEVMKFRTDKDVTKAVLEQARSLGLSYETFLEIEALFMDRSGV